MKTYWTKGTESARSKFIYTELDKEHAVKLFAKTKQLEDIKETDKVHITTDAMADTYLKKRTVQPIMVHYCRTKKDVNAMMEKLGYEI